jgi:putative oxidoreductase
MLFLTAVVGVHWSKGFFSSNRGYEYPLVLFAMAVALLISGGGLLSFDKALTPPGRGRR